MLNALLGRKIGMTQVFGPNGTAIPVTVIEAGPCFVTQVKTVARDGYEAVQIGFEGIVTRRPESEREEKSGKRRKQSTRPKHPTRAELGHLGHSLPLLKGQRKSLQAYQQKQHAKSEAANAESADINQSEVTATEEGPNTRIERLLHLRDNRQRRPGPELGPFKVMREVGLQDGTSTEDMKLGESFNVGLFRNGESVDIVGTTKGKGFQGGVKRHGFSGGPRTHGQSDRTRAPGSIGSGTTPGRVLKGTRMAGRMGNARVTAKKLQVIQADPERNLLVVKGSVPGANGSLLVIKKQVMR
jgi:large subunit ribosomal protein L3